MSATTMVSSSNWRDQAPPRPKAEAASEAGREPDEGSVLVMKGDSELASLTMLARELSNLLGVRGYAGQKVVTGARELGRLVLAQQRGASLCLGVDIERGWIVLAVPGCGAALLEGGDSRVSLLRRLADELDLDGATGRLEVRFRY